MKLLEFVPAKWLAVLVGVAFGSLALVALEGPNKGYGKSIIAACMTAPLMALIAGALLPNDTTLEIAALVGGVTALGGMALVLAVHRFAPSMVIAGLTGMAKSYLHVTATPPGQHADTTRVRPDGTPEDPSDELERLARELDDEPH